MARGQPTKKPVRQPRRRTKPKADERRKSRLTIWLEQHLQAWVASLGRLYRAPMPSLMTAAVLSIALALPASFLLFLDNARQVTGAWEGGVRISLFLEQQVSATRQQELLRELRGIEEVAHARLISPEQGLAEFQRLSGFEDALALLDDNPLPPVIELLQFFNNIKIFLRTNASS